jgi:SAM-dependent methyltransferase
MVFAGRQGEEIRKLQSYLDGELSDRQPVCVLEAGCGSSTYLNFGKQARLVGIDISKKQLDRNDLLCEKILGDIQRYDLPPESFDVVICWDVLEHLPEPELAVLRFSRAIKPGGFAILKLPNVFSLKGLVTKFVPHKVHVLAYRYFYSDKNAGKEDRAPFRTYLRFRASAISLKKQGARLGLRSVYSSTFDVAEIDWLRQAKAVHFFYIAIKAVSAFLSLGRLGDSELILVMRKDA